MIGDIPHIASSNYGASTSTFALGGGGFVGVAQGGLDNISQNTSSGNLFGGNAPTRVLAGLLPLNPNNQLPQQQEPKMAAAPTRRLVQVFIADPDENVPLDKSLLYTGSQKLTDATDQELYFEIDIKAILEKHNTLRAATINKKVKERVEYLEPARVRDLRMVVVNVATF